MPWQPPRALRALTSLKWRITLGTLVVVALSVLGVVSELARRVQADTLAAQRERELGDAVQAASMLSRRIVGLQRALQAAASQIDRELIADDAQLQLFFHAKPVLRDMFADVFLATRDGAVQVVADHEGIRKPDRYVQDRDYFRRTIAEGRPIVSEPLPARDSGTPVLVFTYPLKNHEGVYGLIAGTLHLADRAMLADIAEVDRDNSAAMLLVSDAQGRILAHPDPRRLLKSLATEPRLMRAYGQWVNAGSPVEPSGLRLDEPGEVVGVAGVAGPDWVVWRTVPEAELVQPLVAARRHAMLLAVAAVLVVSVLTVAVVMRMFAPLARLEQRALHLLDDTHDASQGWPEARGEIGSLARVLRQVSTERARAEAHNNANLRRLSSVMAAAPVGIAFTHARRFVLVSDEMCRMFGRSEEQLLNQSTAVIYANETDAEAIDPLVIQAFKAGQPYAGEWLLRRADGTTFWGQLRGRPVDPQDPTAGVIWSILDIHAEVAARTRLEWSATHDALTGLANRKAFEARLEQVFGAQDPSLPASLIAVDLDRFKPINDEFGHAAGDAVLRAVAAAISSCVRVNDLVVRTGGDEFAVLLEHCPHEVAMRLASAILERITQVAVPWPQAPAAEAVAASGDAGAAARPGPPAEPRVLKVGASLGVAALGADTPDATAWVAAADAACYAAKAAGRGTIRSAPARSLRLVGPAPTAGGARG